MSVNSSGSVERFMLATGESKSFEVQAPGGTQWVIDAHGEVFQDVAGALSGASATVELQTAEAVAAAKAAKTYGTTNTITLTAVSTGTAGNSIQAQFVDPGANDQPLKVEVTGSLIRVVYATGPAGAITSLPAQVKAAIETTAAAAALVTVASAGTAAMAAIALAPLAGGTNAGVGSFSTVGSAITVVAGGVKTLTGATGRYAKIINTSGALVSIVAKPTYRVQPLVSL